MIKGFIFENFKGFRKAELFLEDISVLIGANASGKSNAIEGIKILSEIVTGRELSSILDGTRNTESFVRGGSKGCCRFNSTFFSLGCLVNLDSKKDLLYKIKIHVEDTIYVEAESLSIVPNGEIETEGTNIFSLVGTEFEADKSIVHFGKETKPTVLDIPRTQALLPLLRYPGIKTQAMTPLRRKYIGLVIYDLANIFVLSPDEKIMGGYSRISDKLLKSNCSNLSAALYSVCDDSGNREKLLSIIRELPENEIQDVGFLDPSNGDIMFYLSEKNGTSSERIYASQLSAGTLRAISIIVSLLQEQEGGLVIIDEVDNGLHPSRAKSLISWMRSIAEDRHIDILITTHNVALLNSLEGRTILGVSVTYRDKRTGESVITPFIDMENHAYILASGGIGSAEENNKLTEQDDIIPTMPAWLEA